MHLCPWQDDLESFGPEPTMRPRSMKTTLILAVSGSMIVVVLGISCAMFAYHERSYEEQIAAAQFSLTSLVANDIDDKLTSVHSQLIELSRIVQPEVLRDPERAQEFLDRHAKIHAVFSNGLFFFSDKGALIAESPRFNRRGWDFSFRSYLSTTLATKKPYISAPYYSSHPRNPPAIMMTAPLLDAVGNVVGVLGGSIDLLNDRVLGRAVNIRSGKTGYFFVFDRDRRMILHPDRSRILKQDVPVGSNALLDRAVAGFEGTEETVNSRGLRAITSFKHLTATEWIVGANYPVVEAYAPIYLAKQVLLLAIAAATCGVIALVWSLMNRLTRPLLDFTNHVGSISRKHGRERLAAVTTRDEIGRLAQTFNRMVTDLDEKQAELGASTAALQAANIELAAAHAKASHSRDNLRDILESIPDAVVMTRLDGSVAFVNAAGQRMFGIVPGSPISTKLVQDRVLPEDHPILRRRREAAAAGRDPGNTTVRVLAKEGVRECEISGRRVDFDGHPAIVTVVRDITERREMDRKIVLTERMASLGTLTAGVAHEINNPLSYVLGNLRHMATELLDHGSQLPPDWLSDMRASTSEALEGGERVRRIVQDLLAFSRPSEKLGAVDVHRVLELAISMAMSKIRYRARLVRDYAEIPPAQADDCRLGQVALNLIVNAAQAIPEDRQEDNEIRVVTRMEGAHHVVIEVQDTGCGIPPEVQSRMFEPFFTTKPFGAGTGLGLSICHGIVHSLGGVITVQSEVGRGSTFRVVLRAAPVATTASAAAMLVRDARGREPDRRPLPLLDDAPPT